MNRLILHIGMPKTGSSSLQRFFFGNQKALSEVGIFYPSRFQHNLAYSISPGGIQRQQFDKHGMTFDTLGKTLNTRDEDVLLLSSEAFYNSVRSKTSLETIYQFASDNKSSLEVIVFVRDQHGAINSTYAQNTISLRSTLTFKQYFEWQFSLPRNDYADLDILWGRGLVDVFTPVPFAASQLKPDLETLFFKSVGLDDRVEKLLATAPREVINRRRGPKTVETLRRLAVRLGVKLETGNPKEFPLQTRLELMRIAVKSCRDRGWDEVPFCGLDNVMRDKIRDRFADTNDEFARRHWGRDWHAIFKEEYERDFIANNMDHQCSEEDAESINDVVEAVVRSANVS